MFIKFTFLLLLVSLVYSLPNYDGYCSDFDNTFLPPCNEGCHIVKSTYYTITDGYNIDFVFAEDILKSVSFDLQTLGDLYPYYSNFSSYYDIPNKIRLCNNVNTGKNCNDYCERGGLVQCSDFLNSLLRYPGGNVATTECVSSSFCHCDAYFFTPIKEIIYNGTNYEILDIMEINYCRFTNDPLSKRSIGTVYPMMINQDSNENITCWTQEIGDSTFLVVHRDMIPLATSTILVDFGYNAVETYTFSTLDLPIEIPKTVKKRGGLITATDIEGGLAVASCLIDINGDTCYGEDDSITNWECSSWYTRMISILIGIGLTVLIIVGLLLMAIMLYLIFRCLRNTNYSKIPAVDKSTAMATGILGFFTPKVEASALSNDDASIAMLTITSFIAFITLISLCINIYVFCFSEKMAKEYKNDKKKWKKSQESSDTNSFLPKKPSGPTYSRLVITLCCLVLCLGLSQAQNCQEQFFFSQSNTNCVSSSGSLSCNLNTAFTSTIENPSKSICLSSTDPKYPFEVDITYVSSIEKLNLNPLYYTDDFITYTERACICDVTNAGVQQCETCDSSTDVSLCDSDETDFVQYKTSTNYCSYISENDPCPLSYTKVYSSNHYSLVNSTPEYIMYEAIDYDFFPSVSVKVKANGTETTCNAFLTNSFQTVCGLQIRLKDSVKRSLSQKVGISKSVYYPEFSYEPLYNERGDTSICAPGIMQMPSISSTEEDTNVLWGNICTKGTIDSTGGSGCDLVQNFDCCSPAIAQNILPYATQYGLLEQTNYNGVDIVYINSLLNDPINLDIAFNGNFTFQSQTTPVCPKVTYVSPVSGCFSCDSVASFTLGALSTCSPGSALLTCPGITISNPVVNLDTTYTETIIYFTSDQANINFQCKLTATSEDKFTIKGTLSDPIYTISAPRNASTTEFMSQNKELSKIHADNNTIKKLELAFGITTVAIVFLIVIIAVILCIMLAISNSVKKLI